MEGEVECEYGVIEGFLCGSLISSQVATVGPSARVYGDVIYNVLELDRVRRTNPVYQRHRCTPSYRFISS